MMKIIVTHSSPDLDAIASVWLVRKFLPGWENAIVKFVAAGERIDKGKWKNSDESALIERIEDNDVIHVDTGLGPLDHHQILSDKVSAASLAWNFIKTKNKELKAAGSEKIKNRTEAVSRMVQVIVDFDHFKEIFQKDTLADYHEFNLINILEGLEFQFPGKDDYSMEFVGKVLDAILHEFENRIWAEKEISRVGIKFQTRFGQGMGLETINDSTIKLAQKMGYMIVARKDPRKGYVRIKAMPATKKINIDLTPVYKKLKDLDSDATWYLHVSRKMLLNGSTKNPEFRPTKLALNEIIRLLERI